MELPLLQVIVSSCLAAECTSCAEREVMFISFFTSPADFLHSKYVYVFVFHHWSPFTWKRVNTF